MTRITKVQANLLAAIEAGDETRVRKILTYDIDLDFVSAANKSPLHTAIREGEHTIIALLIGQDADVNLQDKNGKTPLDIAIEERDARAIMLIKMAGGKPAPEPFDEGDEDDWDFWRDPVPGKPSKKPPEPKKTTPGKEEEKAFTPEKLKEIFNAEKWVGKTDEMEKLWEEVPKKLKKTFDFAAALAEARRETAKTRLKSKGKPGLPKKPDSDK
jgi:hypothetical protein